MSKEALGDFEIELELDPIVAEGEEKQQGDFNISIDVTQEDGSINPLAIKGKYFIRDGNRYIYFHKLKPANTVEGHIQRRIARQNQLFIIDKKMMEKTEGKTKTTLKK